VKRHDFPPSEALAWYMADKPSLGEGTAARTMRTHFSHLRRFIDWLGPERRTLRSLEAETYERYVRATTTKQNTRMNKIVAAKSFVRYLADRKLWYAGTADARLSVLLALKQPRPSAKGQAGYTGRLRLARDATRLRTEC
jgi:site-specific recombinase XerD